ncbi:MAG TPA: CBS domain-containing protein [Anaerolineae bacterium]|nr:CBS domain-containing protein [Anaerolineae bacterium]
MLTAYDLMTIDPITVKPETPLLEVVALMNKVGNRQLLVVSDDGELVGIVTDRDVRLAVNSPLVTDEPLDRIQVLEQHTAVECMTRDPKTIPSDTPIHKVAQLLSAYKYGALPVVDDGQLVGIVTVTDLLNQMALLPEPD